MNPRLPNKLVTLSLFFNSTLMTFAGSNDKPRVFVLTDINIDPDHKLDHLKKTAGMAGIGL